MLQVSGAVALGVAHDGGGGGPAFAVLPAEDEDRQRPKEDPLHEGQDIVIVGAGNSRESLLHEFAYVPRPNIGDRSVRTPWPMLLNLSFVNHVILSGTGALWIICHHGLHKVRNSASGGGLVNPVARTQVVTGLPSGGLKIPAFEFVPARAR
jgi:hypothetical protein